VKKPCRACRFSARLLALGFYHFDQSMSGDEVSEYHVQAAIAATHARAPAPQEIDWPAILRLYDQLLAINPSPIVKLNRAVAVSKLHGPEEALRLLEPLDEDPKLVNYYLRLAVRGHLLLQLGRKQEARRYFERAQACPCTEPKKRFLSRKLLECQ